MNYQDALQEIILADDRIMVITAENRSPIRELLPLLGSRFVDVGISEQSMIGLAAGLALRGRVPIVHALAAFLTMRAFEFIRTDVGLASLPVKLVGAGGGFLSEANGPTHQALEDVALMRVIPSMGVFCPADAQDLALGLAPIVRSKHPWYIRYTDLPPCVAHDPAFEIGRAELVRDGSDVVILVHGMLLREAFKACHLLEAEGISVRLLNMRTVKPVDQAAVRAAAGNTRLMVTLEDHFLTGGLFSAVSEVLAREGTSTPVLPLGLAERWFQPAPLQDVLIHEGFTGEQIATTIAQHLR